MNRKHRAKICFECGPVGDDESLMDHHVVPWALGGTRTVPLCEECHGKIHRRSFENHARLVRLGLERAKAAGKLLGRKKGTGYAPETLLSRHADVAKLLRAGHSIRHVAAITGKATGTVLRVKRADFEVGKLAQARV